MFVAEIFRASNAVVLNSLQTFKFFSTFVTSITAATWGMIDWANIILLCIVHIIACLAYHRWFNYWTVWVFSFKTDITFLTMTIIISNRIINFRSCINLISPKKINYPFDKTQSELEDLWREINKAKNQSEDKC